MPMFMKTKFRTAPGGKPADKSEEEGRCVCATAAMMNHRLSHNLDPKEPMIAEFRYYPECKRYRQECYRPNKSPEPPADQIYS